MKRVTRSLHVLAAALMLASPSLARAQSTAAMIDSAVALYNKFEIEASRQLLQQVLSPAWVQPIVDSQKVKAYKYLGASYALSGKKDSASNIYQGAIGYDAFTDLDRNIFSALEIEAFDLAKSKLFRVGVRPLRARVLDPKAAAADSTIYNFRITTTQRADVSVTISRKAIGRDSSLSEEIFKGINDGPRDIPWRGTLNNRLAPPGTYEMRINGVSLGKETQNEAQVFVIEHSFETLEDTLPAFTVADTLVESYGARDPLWDLTKGLALGVATFAISSFALDDTKINEKDRGTWSAHWRVAAGAGIGAGLLSYRYRGKNLKKPEAIAENAVRRNKRLEFNRMVLQRNADRLDKTKLIICPLGLNC